MRLPGKVCCEFDGGSVLFHRAINGPQSAAMAAQTAAASLSGYVDFAKWGMDGFTDSDEEDFLCTCGKVPFSSLGCSLICPFSVLV